MKILIIKLGALGDVIRTLPIATALKKKYKGSKIYWITKKESLDIFQGNPDIAHVFSLPYKAKDGFDILYNFDIENEATSLASKVNAKKKYGFYKEGKYAAAFNLDAEYYLNTIFDDDLKKENKKTYQEMMFKAAEIKYKKEMPQIYLTKKDLDYAKKFISNNKIETKNLLGIHMGASQRWPSKSWSQERLKEFIVKAKKQNYEILLFAGPQEEEKQKEIIDYLKQKNIYVYTNNPNNSLKEFASLVNICKKIVCSDSLALHMGIALKKPTVGLFFCTTPHEVEGYGLLKKIISKKLYDFFPQKQDQYSADLVNSISTDEVLDALEDDKIDVVNAIIKSKKSQKFLVIKRKKQDKIHSNKWAFPGGLIKKGESTEKALRREIKEETGLQMQNIVKKISQYTYKKTTGQKIKGECYLITVKDENIKKSNEISDIKWVSIEEFEKLDHIKGLEQEVFLALY